ncbi:uncharacterized protein B0I36DRAFT_309495 [Microdochium trichocladiopsis]|uniref:60Kd inner membrane protein-domain-containing protein n=1 Tax=Microdochium trichocladiopsis TaxID=1682393 RepID=A0A9P8YIW0_9PEZI|nr:uncharacterized protein B0I36DRAFT_309495 [Microdochium trichocladiopsis]KAH7039850.1 hypothetical protein B0I36DRAFT_309495 [Microdochium trichocladiopsis]
MSLASRCLRPLRQPSPRTLASVLAQRPWSPTTPSSSTARVFATHGQRRSLHISPLVASVLETSQSMIVGLHNVTGTPWYLTIPLVALSVTAVFRLPFTLHNQKLLQWRTRYTPVIQAWGPTIMRRVINDGIALPQQGKAIQARTKAATKYLWKKAGLQQWKLYAGFISMPFWLVAIDSIRRLCGGPRGLLGSFILPRPEEPAPPASTPSASDSLHTSARDMVGNVDTDAASEVVVDAARSIAEPSLMTEGALWFQDLTVADPYGILPAALSFVLLMNIIPRNNARARELFGLQPAHAPLVPSKDGAGGAPPAPPQYSRLQRGFGRSMIIISALVGPLTMDLPAAIHLYWLTSACASGAATRIAAWRYPLETKIVRPCKGAELPIVRPRDGPKGPVKTIE